MERNGIFLHESKFLIFPFFIRVILLDAFTSFEYTSEAYGDDLTPPFLRVLQTTTAPVIKGFVPFESPNLVKGLASALINHVSCKTH
jgi:hypothetical protein